MLSCHSARVSTSTSTTGFVVDETRALLVLMLALALGTGAIAAVARALPAGSVPVRHDVGGWVAGGKLDVNTARQGELERIPGIGPSLAARIIALRTARGSFHSLQDLDDVDGIGDKTIAKLEQWLTISSVKP
jgi:competence protein ComEA